MESPFMMPNMPLLIPSALFLKMLNIATMKKRYFCIGFVNGGVATVRFTIRGDSIRIFGAGYWRKGKKLYEKNN